MFSMNTRRLHRCLNLVILLHLCRVLVLSTYTNDFISHHCSITFNYTANSTFQSSLHDLFISLNINVSATGFYNASAGQEPSQAYGLALCRGDVPGYVCHDCTSNATTQMVHLCPNSRDAIIWYDYCEVRYSNSNFIGVLDTNNTAWLSTTSRNATNQTLFSQQLGTLLRNLTDAVVSDSRRLFAVGEIALSQQQPQQRMYGLEQCTRDISLSDCKHCLEDVISFIPICCHGREGGQVLKESCNVRFDTVPFLYEEQQQVDQMRPPMFPLDSIRAATDNFSEANDIGGGGFGRVYKGTLSNGQEIAVKRLSKRSDQGEPEFKNEVELIAKLQHNNLVGLLGCCLEEEEMILIYEYVPNSSLDKFLFRGDAPHEQLNWGIRFNIILGTARALTYLHEDSRLKIIHRDLKPSNILLDKHMNPRISDFGLARLLESGQTHGSTIRNAGTIGYMAPEYLNNGWYSIKSDVFSFGVIVLEIVSGQKNASFYEPNRAKGLLCRAWDLWMENRALEFVDLRLGTLYDESEVLRCIHVGLHCVQEDAAFRPTMSEAELMLKSKFSMALPTPSAPAFSRPTSCPLPNEPQDNQTAPDRLRSESNNCVTISELEGR